MKRYHPSTPGVLAVILVALLIGACARTQIDTHLPVSHPANPSAEAAVFAPPPNPFTMSTFDAQPAEKPTGSGDGARHGEHQKNQDDAGHRNGMPMTGPKRDAAAGSSEKPTGHQH